MPHSDIEVPEKLPLYIQLEMVPFPYMVFPVYVNDRDLLPFTEADRYDRMVAVVLRRAADSDGERPGGISEIGTLCRKIARKIAEGEKKKFIVTAVTVRKFLGPPRYLRGDEREKNEVGIATGLA